MGLDSKTGDLPVGQIGDGCTRSPSVIARSEATKQSSFLFLGVKAGLLRGACHRAARCADPVARNDDWGQHRSPALTLIDLCFNF
jgi:hypothetical protein